MRNVSLDTKDALLNNSIYNKIIGPELGHSRATTREEWFTMDTDTGSERLHWWSLTVKPMHNLFHLLNSRFITVAILQCNRVLGDTIVDQPSTERNNSLNSELFNICLQLHKSFFAESSSYCTVQQQRESGPGESRILKHWLWWHDTTLSLSPGTDHTQTAPFNTQLWWTEHYPPNMKLTSHRSTQLSTQQFLTQNWGEDWPSASYILLFSKNLYGRTYARSIATLNWRKKIIFEYLIGMKKIKDYIEHSRSRIPFL